MLALSLKTPDGIGAISLDEVAQSEPGAGEVRVALKAASLNHRELWIAKGQYPGMCLPATLGCDGAGVVDAVGAGVDTQVIGREVVLYPGLNWGDDPAYPAAPFGLLGMPGPGTLAESIVIPAASAVAKPTHLDWDTAAAVPLAALTAWRGLTTKGGIQTGDKLLITGIGGGVATMALKLAKALGAEVYVTSGSDETLAKAQALGAKAGFNYKDENWKKALGKTSGGIDLVFDGAPASGYAAYGRSLSMGARVVVYGSTGGMSFPVNAPELFLKNIRIIGTNVGNLAEFEQVIAFISAQKIEPVIDRHFSLADAKEALIYLESAHSFGKVVVTP
jgi:NADPH:quinone reductase-like Zn-dependent oxidoreductase